MKKISPRLLAGAGALAVTAGMFVGFAAPAFAATPTPETLTICNGGDYDATVRIQAGSQSEQFPPVAPGQCAHEANLNDSSITPDNGAIAIEALGDFNGDGKFDLQNERIGKVFNLVRTGNGGFEVDFSGATQVGGSQGVDKAAAQAFITGSDGGRSQF